MNIPTTPQNVVQDCDPMPPEAPKPDEVAALPTEEDLLHALRMKAEAYANKAWEEHWRKVGPSLLAQGWTATHPDIPLMYVKVLVSYLYVMLGFLMCTYSGFYTEWGGGGGIPLLIDCTQSVLSRA